ncbi:MAG: DUF3501 family protein [Anaeromyxobacter sp.]|nr:DUF3501 family protein [Anaeromyxobacter sp.]
MRHVTREEILPLEAYERARPEIRPAIIEAKKPRRIHVGPNLTLLFENTATIRYQVQEMVKAERMTREADIRHELETYNELLGGPGELGATLLIEITDPAERDDKLGRWRGLEAHLYLALENGTRVRATYDARQVSEERLSSVQYLKFDVKGQVPVAAGADLPALTLEVALTPEQRAALRQDLAAGT